MSISFTGSELINKAISIEKRGVDFYDTIGKSNKTAETRELYKYQADTEREHIKIFQGMLTQVGSSEVSWTSPQEYSPYLHALMNSAVFTADKVTSKKATQAEYLFEALELAIGAEKDSMLFYNEMKDRIPKQAQETVNRIIIEEKSHLEKLSLLRNKLKSPV